MHREVMSRSKAQIIWITFTEGRSTNFHKQQIFIYYKQGTHITIPIKINRYRAKFAQKTNKTGQNYQLRNNDNHNK